jgi:uncharacterized protein with von Willebrand factor type A (vWA) domain
MYQEIGAPAGETDLVIITDAKCRVGPDLRDRFLSWKRREKVRVASLVIGSAPGDLAALSDEVHHVGALEAAGEAVGRVLSL